MLQRYHRNVVHEVERLDASTGEMRAHVQEPAPQPGPIREVPVDTPAESAGVPHAGLHRIAEYETVIEGNHVAGTVGRDNDGNAIRRWGKDPYRDGWGGLRARPRYLVAAVGNGKARI